MSLRSRLPLLFRAGTLSRKILAGVLPVILLLAFLMGTFSFYLVRRQILLGVQKEIDMVAQQAAQGLGSFFQQRVNDAESLSETPLIGDFLKNREYGLSQEAEVYRNELARLFKNFADRAKVYDQIAYLGPDGRLVCSSLEGTRRSAAIPAVHRPPRAKPSSEDLRTGEGLLIKRYCKPVFDPFGSYIGSVVLDCDTRHVEDILNRLRVGETGGAFLEDEQGRVVLGHRPEFSYSLTGVSAIPGTAWRVGVEARVDDFLDPLKQIRNLMILFAVFASLAVLFLALSKISDLLQPLRIMVGGTRRFAAGELGYRLPDPDTEELKTLASSFNQMAESLEQRTRDLEARLRELTALRDMDGAVIQRLDEATILKTCLESVAKGFSFDRVALYWVDHVRGEIYGRRIFGISQDTISEEKFRARRLPLDGDDILCEVARKRKAVLVNDLADPRVNRSFIKETRTREFVLAPIGGKDRVLGILAADNYDTGRRLKESDKEGLTLFANAVGLALENAMLFQNLAESEARTRAILENSPVAIIGLSKEHWIQTWNRGAESIFGYSAQELTGKPLAALFGPDSAEASTRLLSEVMAKGSVRDYSMPGVTKSGRQLELSLSWGGSYPDFWINKEWTVVIRDVTEARKLQQQIIRSEKLSAVGQLISGIAHELNNPLQSVVGYAEMLAEGLKPNAPRALRIPGGAAKDIEGDLNVIMENAVRCRKIIDNLLLFVRQGEVEKRAVPLARVARASVELLSYKLRKVANIAVTLDIPKGLPPVRANFQQIQQVLVNLINNACDAMAGSAGKKSVVLRAVRLPGRIRVEIADNGPGVAADVRGRLFEPFFTTKSEGRGTGLGLAVCKQILDEHGGSIGCESEPGHGATFWFELPWGTKDREASRVRSRRGRPVAGKTVLLVDDEPDILALLTKVVLAEGDRAVTARSVQEAAARAKDGKVDLVVTDIRLDDGSGVQLWDGWEGWTSRARPPFVFMTGDVINPALAQEIESRGCTLLHKPIDLQTFQGTVRSLLSGKKISAK